MTAWRQAVELAIGEKDLAQLGAILRSKPPSLKISGKWLWDLGDLGNPWRLYSF